MHPVSTRRTALVLFAAVTAIASTGPAWADEAKGTLGFAAKVDADGLFSPTLKTVHIQSLQPGLPAALAGVAVGDSILEVDGIKVAGAPAGAMAARMKKKPGESVQLKLSRPSGETYVVTLVAVAPKP